MQNDAHTLNVKLRYQRQMRGWSQKKLADVLDTSKELIGRWERGVQQPSPYYQEKLCVLFKKSAEELGFIQAPPVQDDITETSYTTVVVQRSGEGNERTLLNTSPDVLSSHTSVQTRPNKVLLTTERVVLVEDVSTDCATWFSERLARIIAYVTQQKRFMHVTDFEKQLDRELRMFDEINPLFNPDTYFLSRRSALLVIASLPKGLLGVLQYQKDAFIREEFLPTCAASLTACWYLLNGREFVSVERAVTRYLSLLVRWAHQTSMYQKSAAYLASQACMLCGFVELHRLQFHQRVLYCQEAVKCARIAGDASLLVKALTLLGNAYYFQRQYREMLRTFQEAEHLMKDAPHSLQSKVLTGLSLTYARYGQETQALETIGRAREVFTEELEDVPAFLTVDDGEYSLILFEGWVCLDLGKCYPDKDYYKQAERAFAQIEQVSTMTLVPQRYWHEIVNRRAQTAVASGELDTFYHFTLQSAKILQSMQSAKRRQELVSNYKSALKKWPHESKIVELADLVL